MSYGEFRRPKLCTRSAKVFLTSVINPVLKFEKQAKAQKRGICILISGAMIDFRTDLTCA